MTRSRAVRLALAVTAAFVHSALADSAWTRSPLKPDATLNNSLERRGKEVFDARCRVCHGAYSKNASQGSSLYALPPMPGTLALELRYKGQKPAPLEERTDLTPALISSVVRRGGGGFMPAIRPTEVSDEDLKALSAYLTRKR